MPRKSLNAGDDLDLSLSGSQLLSPGGSARRPSFAKSTPRRPGSSSGQRDKSTLNVVNGITGRQSSSSSRGRPRSNSQNSQRRLSGSSDGRTGSGGGGESSRSTARSAAPAKDSPGDDFLALFESSTQPKIMKPSGGRSQHGRSQRPAWATPVNSARSAATVDSEGDHLSHATGGGHSHFTHSVFQPTTARTTSTARTARTTATLEDEDLENHNSHRHLGSAREELRLNLDQREPSHEDINFNFDQKQFDVKPLSVDQRSTTHEETSRSRNSAYGDPGSQYDTSNHKTHKLNSIANNMTSQAMSPGTKMALLDMENSYQNIKPKTPVNQVRQSPLNPANSKPSKADYARIINMSATKIQRWFRRHQTRRKAGQAAMKRLLDSKRAEKVEELAHKKDYVTSSQTSLPSTEQRKKIREEKARQARHDAIHELQRKREEKRKDGEGKGEKEVKYLQKSGKVSKTAAHSKSNNVRRKKGSPRGEEVEEQAGGGSESDNEQVPGAVGGQAPRTTNGGAVNKRIDDIFQNNSPRPSVHNNQEEAPPGGGGESEEDDRTISALQTDRSRQASARGAEGGQSAEERSLAASHAGTKTTLDDLMETLKKLEEEEKLPGEGHNKNKTPRNWLDDLDKAASDDNKSDVALLTADKLETLNPSKDNIKKSGFLTDEKLRSIISFLDEVETADRIDEMEQDMTKGSESVRSGMVSNELAAGLPALLVPSVDEIREMEQATAVASEVTNKVLSQRLEIDEKQRSISMLQKALNQQRELTIRHARETEKEMKQRLDVQKDEYEETIKRHLSFIDQLIDDKKALSEKCENLVKELKQGDKKYQDKLKLLKDNHDIEMKKIKEVQAAAEKLRREKWIDEKTKKIKEMTVKGLEPEIQRLIAKHKSEMKKIKSIQEAELLESDERAAQRYVTMIEELRDQLAGEKEAACARERDLARQTYEKQLQQEEEAYQQQRRRLYQEVQEEKERLASASSRQRQELDKLQRQLEDNHSNAADVMRKEYEKAREEQERRHTTETRQLKEQLAVEKSAWEENYKKRQETWLMSRERELKDQVRQDRDKEIEDVITRLEEDNQMAREECERVAENRIKRIRDKYEGEIAELERSERITTQKYNETKANLAEYEGENERMKVTLRERDRDISELKELLEKRNEERDRVADVIRQEFADKIVVTEDENRRVKNEMSEMKARHRLELERAKAEIEIITKSKEEELEEVHKRVKQAIVKKEEVVNQLKGQYQAALKRADHLEGLLEQQRKQLLKK